MRHTLGANGGMRARWQAAHADAPIHPRAEDLAGHRVCGLERRLRAAPEGIVPGGGVVSGAEQTHLRDHHRHRAQPWRRRRGVRNGDLEPLEAMRVRWAVPFCHGNAR
jgi:hypothetical protein